MDKNRWSSIASGVVREIAIVTLCATVAVFAYDKVRDRFFSSKAVEVHSYQPASLRTGAIGISISNADFFDFTKSKINVVIVVSPNCSYCLKSVDFYRVLAAKAKDRSIPLVVALPKLDNEAAGFLKSAGLEHSQLRKWDNLSIQVEGTPTLLIVNSRGSIERLWIGALAESRESDVLSLLDDPNLLSASKLRPKRLGSGEVNLSEEDLVREDTTSANRVFIDLSDRNTFRKGHRSDAINIPFEELYIRSRFELKQGVPYVVDCSRLDERACRAAIDMMARRKLKSVALNAGGVATSFCRTTAVISGN